MKNKNWIIPVFLVDPVFPYHSRRPHHRSIRQGKVLADFLHTKADTQVGNVLRDEELYPIWFRAWDK